LFALSVASCLIVPLTKLSFGGSVIFSTYSKYSFLLQYK
jgi:hypothetical protein